MQQKKNFNFEIRNYCFLVIIILRKKTNSRERDQVTYHSKTNKIECMDI